MRRKIKLSDDIRVAGHLVITAFRDGKERAIALYVETLDQALIRKFGLASRTLTQHLYETTS